MIPLLVSILFLASPSAPQQGTELQQRAVPLRQSAPGRVVGVGAPDCFDEPTWRRRLASSDLDQREQAFEELLRLLPRCAEAQSALQTWVARNEPHLAWSARLALRELRHRPRVGWTRIRLGETLFTPTASSTPEAPSLREFPELSQGLFAFGGDLGLHSPRNFSLPGAICEQREGSAYCVRKDGSQVQVQIVETRAGEESTREFNGASLEEILRANPDLVGELSLQGNRGSMHLMFQGGWLNVRPRQVRIGEHFVIAGDTPANDMLGVICGPVGIERTQRLGLEAGLGLVVERTVPGSIAALIDLRRGDVLLELNGFGLRGYDDLRRGMLSAEESSSVVVRIVDHEGQPRTYTWEPESSGEDESEVGGK